MALTFTPIDSAEAEPERPRRLKFTPLDVGGNVSRETVPQPESPGVLSRVGDFIKGAGEAVTAAIKAAPTEISRSLAETSPLQAIVQPIARRVFGINEPKPEDQTALVGRAAQTINPNARLGVAAGIDPNAPLPLARPGPESTFSPGVTLSPEELQRRQGIAETVGGARQTIGPPTAPLTTPGKLFQAASEATKTAGAVPRGIVSGAQQLYTQGEGIAAGVADLIGADDASSYFAQSRRERGAIEGNLPKQRGIDQFVSEAVSNVVSNAPFYWAGMGALKGATTPAQVARIGESFALQQGPTLAMALGAAGASYNDPSRAHMDRVDRLRAAAVDAFWEWTGEQLGFGQTIRAMKAAGIGGQQLRDGIRAAVGEGIGEAVTQIGQIENELQYNLRPNMTPQEYVGEVAKAAAMGSIVSGSMQASQQARRGLGERVQYGSVGSTMLNEVRQRIATRREQTRAELDALARELDVTQPAAPRPPTYATGAPAAPRQPAAGFFTVEQPVEYGGGQPQQVGIAEPERGLIEVPGRAEPVSPSDFSRQIAPTVLRTQLEERRERDRRAQAPDEEAAPLRSSYEAALARYPATAPEEVENDPAYENALKDAGVETVDRQPLPVSNTEVILAAREHRPGTRGIVTFVDELERKDNGAFLRQHGLSKADVVKSIVQMERNAREGSGSAMWYEETIGAWRKMFRGDRQAMDTFAQIIAITSANTEVKANWSIALKALMQYYRGKPINVKSRSDNEKLNSILYDGLPWEGRKTNAFYEEMSRLIWGRKRATTADTVQDIHMTRATLGKEVPGTKAEYDFGDAITKLIAERKNWSPQQAQAAIWVGKKADSLYEQFDVKRRAARSGGKWSKYATYTDGQLRAEALDRAKVHYGHLADALGMFPLPEDFKIEDVQARRESGAQLFAETRPTTKTPQGQAIAKQSLKRQRDFQNAALNAIGGARAFAELFGLDRTEARVVPGMGAYQSDGLYVTAPNVVLTARVPRATVEAMSRAWAYVFRQDAVPFYRAVKALKDDTSYPVGVRFTFKEHIKDGTLTEFATRVRELIDPAMGFSVVNPNEIEIVNFSDMEDGEFALRVGDLIAAFRGTIVSAEHFGADGDYLGIDWERAENVDDTRQQIGSAGFSGILPRLEDWQRKIDAVAQRFAAGGEPTDAERRNPFQERRAPKPARAEKLAGGPRQTDIVFAAEGMERGRLHGEEVRQAQALEERIDGPGPVSYAPLNEVAQRAIAQAFERLPRTGGDDAQRAYSALAKEIDRQFDRASEVVTIEPWEQEGQPYRNSAEMRADVLGNHHIYVFSGGEDHAFLTRDQNFRFRAIHDIYGHALTGFEFGPRGEFNATRAHAQMFGAAARPAMISETLGQNSWVNFGPYSHLPVTERPYAEQKAALLPAELWEPLMGEDIEFADIGDLAQTRNAKEIARYAQATQLWRDLAVSDDLFVYPHTRMKDIPDIVKAIDPGIKPSIAFEETDENGVTSMQEWRFQMPDGSHAQMTVDGQEVWLDLVGLTPGQSRGSAMYAIAADYAFNTGRVFIGDPAGITPIGRQRRVENMLSHALKVGSTDHLEPHPSMKLPWEKGNDAFNIGSMVRRAYENAVLDVPRINTIVYNPESDKFETINARAVTDQTFRDLAKKAGSRVSTTGVRTLKRAAVVNTVLREAGEAGGGAGSRLLDRAGNISRGKSRLPAGLEGVFYTAGGIQSLYDQTVVTAKQASLPWFKPGDVRAGVMSPLVQTVNKPQAATLQAAIKDVIAAGMPAHIAQTVDAWGDHVTNNKGSFFPDDGKHVIAVQSEQLDGPNVNYQGLRWWIAHELTHHLDIKSGKRGKDGGIVNDALSAQSPRLDYVVDSGEVLEAQGDLMAEAYAVYERGEESLSALLAYPFSVIDLSHQHVIKSEVLAQMGALYNQRPELMQRHLPRWFAVMEQVYDTEETIEPAQGQEVPSDPRAAFAATREKLRAALQDQGAVEPRAERESGRPTDTGRTGEPDRAGAQGGSAQPVLGVRNPAQPGPSAGGTQQPGVAGRVRAVSAPPSGPPPIHPPIPGWAFNPLNQPFIADQPTRWDAVVRKFQDKLVDTKRVQQAIRQVAQIGQLPDDMDVLLSDELYYGRVALRTQEAWQTHFEPLLREMSRAKLSVDEVGQYLKARHAPERNAQMAKINPNVPNNQALSGMSNQQAAQIIADFRANGKLPHLLGIARRVDAITAAGRTLIVSSGLEPQTTIDAWENVYDHYVPLMRDEDDPGLHAAGFSVSGPESKRAMGSTREAVHILANLFAQHERIIQRSERNKVGLSLYNLVKHAPNGNFWKVHDPGSGSGALPIKRHIDPRTGFVVTGVDPLYKQAPNVIVVKIGGFEHAIVFNERNDRALLMARNLKNLDSARVGPVLDVVARTTRIMANLATQWNPVFWATNFTRDYQTALANLSDTPIANHRMRVTKAISGAMRGMYQHLRGDHSTRWSRLAQEFQREGGMTGFSTIFDGITDREKEIRREVKAGARSGVNPLRLGRAFFEWVGAVNNAVENAIRLAAYTEAKSAGATAPRAAALAKNLTVNFNRKGNATPFIGALYMFFNASVQGNARMIQALAKSRVVQAAVAASATVGFALDVMNRALAGDDDDGNNRWDILPEHLKQRNWIFFTGEGDEYWKIPLPYGYHIFPNAGRLISAALWDTRPQADAYEKAVSFASVVADGLSPLGASPTALQFASPTVADPLVQWAENKSWTGAPIRREQPRFGRAVPEYTLTQRRDSEFAKAASKWLNDISGGDDIKPGAFDFPPALFDHIIRSATLGTGQTISQLADVATKAALGEAITRNAIPLVNRFTGEIDDTIRSREFWDRYSKAKKLLDQASAYRKSGRDDMAEELIGENRPLIDLAQGYKAQAQQLRSLNTERESVELSDDDYADRRAAYKDIESRRVEVLRRVMREAR